MNKFKAVALAAHAQEYDRKEKYLDSKSEDFIQFLVEAQGFERTQAVREWNRLEKKYGEYKHKRLKQ